MKKEEVEIVFLEQILDLKKMLNEYIDDNTSVFHPDSIALTCDVIYKVSENLSLHESSAYSASLYKEATKLALTKLSC